MHADGSVTQVFWFCSLLLKETQEYDTKNPTFILTPEVAIKNVIARFNLVENVHYKVYKKDEKSEPVYKLLANDALKQVFSDNGVDAGKHYKVVQELGSDEFYIRFVACKKGVLPTLLEGLLAKRKEVRAQGENEVDAQILAIIDALQNAYKTMANSMYGATGTGNLILF